jgi:hypothetical protein
MMPSILGADLNLCQGYKISSGSLHDAASLDLTMVAPDDIDANSIQSGSPGEVFRVFLKLGLTSFGGPIAHLGFFHDELVVRRKWIDEAGYGDLIA